MRFLLVDRITEWQPGHIIRGAKNIAMTEDFLEFHFPNNPVMPGVLLLEALVQLAGWLEAISSDFENWFLLRKVDRCLFYEFTLPGDRVDLEVQEKARVSQTEKDFLGSCSVDGKVRMVADFSGAIVRLEELESVPEQKRLFQFLARKELPL